MMATWASCQWRLFFVVVMMATMMATLIYAAPLTLTSSQQGATPLRAQVIRTSTHQLYVLSSTSNLTIWDLTYEPPRLQSAIILQPSVAAAGCMWIEEDHGSLWILTGTVANTYPAPPTAPLLIERQLNSSSFTELNRLSLTSDHGSFAALQISFDAPSSTWPCGLLDPVARHLTMSVRVNQDSYGAALARLDLTTYPNIQPVVVLVGAQYGQDNSNNLLYNPAINRYVVAQTESGMVRLWNSLNMQLLTSISLNGVAGNGGCYSAVLGSVVAGRPYYIAYIGIQGDYTINSNAKIVRVFYNATSLWLPAVNPALDPAPGESFSAVYIAYHPILQLLYCMTPSETTSLRIIDVQDPVVVTLNGSLPQFNLYRQVAFPLDLGGNTKWSPQWAFDITRNVLLDTVLTGSKPGGVWVNLIMMFDASGDICPANTVSSTCKPCAPGYFVDLFTPAGSNTVRRICTLCPIMTYAANYSQASCTPCAYAQYQYTIGSTRCETCAAYKVWNNVSECICDIGAYPSDGDNCAQCSSGKYKATTGSLECASCPANAISNSDYSGCECSSGFITSNQSATTGGQLSCLCDAGTSPVGAACVNCATGKYNPSIGAATCISCPSNSVSFDRLSCQCNIGFYATYASTTGELTCNTCPTGGECSGGMIHATAGYWLPANTSTVLYQCSSEQACTATGCGDGYEGFLCGVCSDGYAKAGSLDSCAQCPGPNTGLLVILIIVMLAFLAKTFHSSGDKNFVSLVILLNHIQMIAEIKLEPNGSIFSYLSIFQLQFLSSSAAPKSCLFPGTFLELWLASLMIPFVTEAALLLVYGVTCLVDWIQARRTGRPAPARFGQYIRSAIGVLLLTFVASSKTAFRMLSCQSVGDDESRLILSPDIICWHGRHIAPLIITIFFLVIVVLGTPTLVYSLLFNKCCCRTSSLVVVKSQKPEMGALPPSPSNDTVGGVGGNGAANTGSHVNTAAVGMSSSTVVQVSPRKEVLISPKDTTSDLLTKPSSHQRNASTASTDTNVNGNNGGMDLSFLYRPYIASQPHWELIVIARRLILVLILVVWSHDDIWRAWLMIMAIYMFTQLHVRYHPYRHHADNAMESLALHALFISYCLELLAHGLQLHYGDDRAKVGIQVLILIGNIGVVICFLPAVFTSLRDFAYRMSLQLCPQSSITRRLSQMNHNHRRKQSALDGGNAAAGGNGGATVAPEKPLPASSSNNDMVVELTNQAARRYSVGSTGSHGNGNGTMTMTMPQLQQQRPPSSVDHKQREDTATSIAINPVE